MADLAASQPSPPRPVRKRRRPAVVCAECRRRKIACDRKTPCGQCALHRVECVYVTGAVPPPYGRAARPPRAPLSPGAEPGLAVPASGGGGGGGPAGLDTAGGSGSAAARAAASGAAACSGSDCGASGPGIKTTTSASPLDDDDDEAAAADAAAAAAAGADVAANSNLTLTSIGERPSRFGGRLAKTRLLGRTHWMNNMDEFKDVHSLMYLVHFATESSIYQSIRTCKRLARLIKDDENRRIAALAATQSGTDPNWLVLPPRAVADRLVDLYCIVYEPLFRILHMPTFRREYEAFMAAKDGRPAPAEADSPPQQLLFLVKLVLVLALGSCFYDDPGDPPAAVALQARLRVAAARALQTADLTTCVPLHKQRLSLDTVQIYCLAMLARQTTALELGDDLTWFSAGGLLHTAFGMGLNRDPSHFKSMSPAQAEMRRRLWATVLELVVQASLDQGMPPLVSADDYDCMPPLNLDDDQFSLDAPSDGVTAAAAAAEIKPHPDTTFTHTSMQRLLCRSLPVRLRITKALNGLATGLTYERALQLSADLLEACRYPAAALRAAPLMAAHDDCLPAERAAFARLRIAFYEILTRRFHHSLHSPFARKAASNVQFFFSRRARLDTVLRLLAFFRQDPPPLPPPWAGSGGRPDDPSLSVPPAAAPATTTSAGSTTTTTTTTTSSSSSSSSACPPPGLLRPTAAEDPCRRLWLVGRGLIKCTVVDVSATAAIEIIHQLQEDYAPGADLTLSQRELLDTVRAVLALAHMRIEAGETNVKGYLFFCAALAQIDALLDGRPVRSAIVDAVTVSAQHTIGTLANLAASKGIPVPHDLLPPPNGGRDGTGTGTGAGTGGVGGGGSGEDPLTDSPVALQTDELPVPPSWGFGGLPGPSAASSVLPAPAAAAAAAAAALGDLSGEFTGDLAGLAGLDDARMGGGGSGTDVDSAIHLPPSSTADLSSAGADWPAHVPWADDWCLDDPMGDAAFGNWFFPYNDRINSR